MEFDKRHGYILQWLIGIGDLVVLNLMFLLVYVLLDSMYTRAIANNLREVLLLLNFCYFFSLYFIPIQLHRSIVYLDKVVQRAFCIITLLIFLFLYHYVIDFPICYVLDFSECRRCAGDLFVGLLCFDDSRVFLLACLGEINAEILSPERIQL